MTGPVLMVTPSWTRDGGVATHVMASAAALAAGGTEVHVLAATVDPAERAPGITFHESPELFNRRLEPRERLGTAMEAAPGIVHFHQFEDPDVATLIQDRAPVVLSVHGYSACTSALHYFRPGEECDRAHGPGCAPNLLGRGCAHTYRLRWLPGSYGRATRSVRLLRQADLAISYSSVIDRHLEVNGARRRARVPLFSTLGTVRAGGHEQRRRVVFAGRIVRAKGAQVLVRAAQSLDAEFVICGSGRDEDYVRSLARRLKVQERVSFRGWLAPSELATELAEASVVAMPSLWPEPFGLIGIEAFAAGRPVVASATGGISDWLEDGISGVAVAPGDPRPLATAIEELLDDPERQRAMGAAGARSVAARFTAEHHVAALLEAYGSTRVDWERRHAPTSPRPRRPAASAPSL
ncbi:MAG: glycosyltransferase family 4 protein [Solirubrobacteraceae bacterium]